MGYKCGMCSAKVDARESKVVTQIRGVEYVHPGSWSDDRVKTSRGWEIVREEKLCRDCQRKLGASFMPQTVASVSREVHETVPKRQRRRMMEGRRDIDYGDRSERSERFDRLGSTTND